MSCYLVNENHIALLASFALKNDLLACSPFYQNDLQDTISVVKCLANANIDAVNNHPSNHNNDNNDIADKIFIANTIDIARAFNPEQFSPGFIAKQIECYEYQCSGRNYDNSNARRIIQVIRDFLLIDINGYKDAPWGMR